MKQIEYISAGLEDLISAAQFYESERAGLGSEFLDAISKTADSIQQNSELWAFCQKPVRSERINRFPYRLFYWESANMIQVVAVAHLTRRPNYWQARAK